MQVKVQTVNELTINQLSEDQYKAEKAAGRIKSGEVYACTPSPVKWEDIQGKPNVSGGGDVDKFYQWLKERNYDLDNFRGLESIFPVKEFAELKITQPRWKDTQISGTGAPNAIVEYDGKQVRIGADGRFVIDGLEPLSDNTEFEILYYDYAGRVRLRYTRIGEAKYAVPDGIRKINSDDVSRYDLNRPDLLSFPYTVEEVADFAFDGCDKITKVKMPRCTTVGASAFSDCTSLASISLPACTTVGEFAFLGSKKLQTVILSDGWTPRKGADIPKTATVYNQDKTKKVNWNTMTWVNV